MSLSEQYKELIKDVLYNGEKEINQRTSTEIKFLLHRAIRINLSEGVPIMTCRKFFPHVAAAELVWMLKGTQETLFIKKYSQMWDKFEDSLNKVNAAYGFRWRQYFGRDQLFDALQALKKDRTSRQIYVTAWAPGEDGLLNIGANKNVPCPIGFFLNIKNKKVYGSVIIRSSDLIVGLPYDIMAYSFLLRVFSIELGLDAGELFVFLNHAHIYRPHYELANEMISKEPSKEYLIVGIDKLITEIAIGEKFIENIKEENKLKIQKLGFDLKLAKPEIIE